ncbi:sorting nexihypothetical protein [Limosa lapponica baueri]|uniref:PX domain-containing protein n=1 Tax=Limosa lapponica baueri TaxID=1758121 RepID=A0A2I0TZ05_LIMLA|nr:sorting nexihypothetical protein [Limosa lapponica baueri]
MTWKYLSGQLRQLFGSAVPAFPPKFYLAMTKSMADERRSQLEQYLQNVTLDPNITNSDVFIGFFRKLQQVTSCKMGLPRELMKYFNFFFFQDHDDGALSVVKKVADFELPYFLELIREVQFYGYVRLDPCVCDYPEEGCSVDIYVGKNEINCYIKLPTKQTKEAFLLSSCLKKMITEQMMKAAKEGQETEIKMPGSTKYSKKSSIQQKQVVHSGFVSRKRFLVRPNEEDCVFEKIREEDL